MFFPDPDFYPSWIPDLGSRVPDPKTATKERGIHKFHKIVNYFIFKMLKKKFGPIFKEL
jgi:hypothetical protein